RRHTGQRGFFSRDQTAAIITEVVYFFEVLTQPSCLNTAQIAMECPWPRPYSFARKLTSSVAVMSGLYTPAFSGASLNCSGVLPVLALMLSMYASNDMFIPRAIVSPTTLECLKHCGPTLQARPHQQPGICVADKLRPNLRLHNF